MDKFNNIVRHPDSVTRADREARHGHRSLVVWFTGLSGAGKSTLAQAMAADLHRQGRHTFVLDGDNIRHGLSKGLGFSPEDRHENLRRAAETARLMVDAGTIVLAAFISPSQSDREMVRNLIGPDDFIEVYVNCPQSVCEERDVKGLYRRARTGSVSSFTGVSAQYTPPLKPDITIDTSRESLDVSLKRLHGALPVLALPTSPKELLKY